MGRILGNGTFPNFCLPIFLCYGLNCEHVLRAEKFPPFLSLAEFSSTIYREQIERLHFYANNAISPMPYMGQIAQGGCKYARSAILVHTMMHIAKNSHAKFCHPSFLC